MLDQLSIGLCVRAPDVDLIEIFGHCGAGLFYETRIGELTDLLPLLSRKIQTVSVFGIPAEELAEFVHSHALNGIDRFVPYGKALEISYLWDGYNLLNSLTREVVVEA